MNKRFNQEPFISKQAFKRRAGKCSICNQTDYDLLDVHRWRIEGKDGGKYTNSNCLCICNGCHRKIHKKRITIIGVFKSTTGRLLNYIDENGKEQFNKI